jgi:transposase
LVFRATHRVSKLDGFKPYLDHRVGQGCTNAVVLFAELKKLGFSGSDQTVRRYLALLRPEGKPPGRTAQAKAPDGKPAPPKPRRVAAWIMTHPDHLKPGNAMQLKGILARCPELDALNRHVAAFAAMMGKLRGDQLQTLMTAVAADDLPALHSMLTGLRRDLDAVTAGLTLPWSSGVVEGHVNRIILWN